MTETSALIVCESLCENLRIGFVYIWRDQRYGRFYIGSHVGSTIDGYVGSNVRLRRAYAKRPEDFRRRILCWASDRKELLRAEERWLSQIKLNELGKRYYNLKRVAAGGDIYSGLTKEKQLAAVAHMVGRTSELHPNARVVVCGGVRYATLLDATRALGFSPRCRLKSKRIKFIDWYYEDVGPRTVVECELYEQELRATYLAHLTELGKQCAARPREWHLERIMKGASAHTGMKHRPISEVGRENLRRAQLGRKHPPETIRKLQEARRLYWQRKKGVAV